MSQHNVPELIPEKCKDEDGTAILCVPRPNQKGRAEGKDTQLCACAPRVISSVNLTSRLYRSRDIHREATATEAVGLSSIGTIAKNWPVQLGIEENVEKVAREVIAVEEQLRYNENSFHEVMGTTRDFTVTTSGDKETGLKLHYTN